MTNKYETGSYLLLLFDKHGTQVDALKKESLLSATEAGESLTKEPPLASFVVMRTLVNSIDRSYPWNCKEPIHERK